MTDTRSQSSASIVWRLRAIMGPTCRIHALEAADEIERLHRLLDTVMEQRHQDANECDQLRRKNITMLNILKACRLLLVQRDQRPDEARVLNAILIVIAEAEGQPE